MAAQQQEIYVPDIGDFKDVEIIEVMVKPGDSINPEDPLITLESDKAAIEVPSPSGGVVKSMKVKVGDRVSKGSPILVLEFEGKAPSEAAKAPPADAPVANKVAPAPSPKAPEVAPAPAAVAPKQPSQPVEQQVRVPDIGDFKDIEVIEVFVKPGDRINREDPLITLESDKAAMEVPSPAEGVVKSIQIKVGDRVSKGAPILLLETADGAVESEKAPAAATPVPAAKPAPQAPVAAGPSAPSVEPAAAMSSRPVESAHRAPPHASPAIRKFARELGADLGKITGSGPKGRVLRSDIQAYVKQSLQRASQPQSASPLALAPLPEIDFSQFGAIENQPLSRIKKLSGAHLHRSWVGIPHVTQYDEADITDLEAFRVSLKREAEQRGVKLTFLPFVIKAVVATLKAFPSFNASLAPDGESLILKRYFHIGVAVDTPDGLVVPVLRDADQKSVYDLANELTEISGRARGKKLRTTDLEGGCFTITSLGGIGGTAFTPIINAPEVAILGLSRAATKPVYRDGQFVPRLQLPLSLSYDHRVVDGAEAARFITHLSNALADLRRVLL